MARNMHSDDESRPAVQVQPPAHQSEGTGAEPACLPLAWKSLVIDRTKRGELVSQFVAGVTDLIESGALLTGERLPSVRRLSRSLEISTFTVAEAYDRLVASGLVMARRGAGYYVNGIRPHPQRSNPAAVVPQTIDALMPELYASAGNLLPLSAGWLPSSWHDSEWMQGVERQAIRRHPRRTQGYGHPLGLPELRELLSHRLSVSGLLAVQSEQILLTRGATHAFDLILRTLARAGDSVLMEEPGYPPLTALIKQHGCSLHRVPRNAAGVHLETLTEMCKRYAPKLFFVQSVLHNPLGTNLSASDTHQLVNLAEKFNFHLVDNDVCRELARVGEPSLAAMDGLERVIRIDSTSKTLSPQIRVGSIYASSELIKTLARVKMATGLTSSELEERIVKHALESSEYRRMVARLQTRLTVAIDNGMRVLCELGLTPLAKPQGGLFIAAGFQPGEREPKSGSLIARLAAETGLLLVPGKLFLKEQVEDPPWFRFNVAWIDHPRVREFFKTINRQ